MFLAQAWFIGSLWCSGFSSAEIKEIVKANVKAKGLISINLQKGILSSNKIRKRLENIYPVDRVEQLPCSFAAITANLNTGEEVAWTKGNLAEVVTASMCIPFFVSPVEIQETKHIDGGFKSYSSLTIVRKMGAERVIAPMIKEYRIEAVSPYKSLGALERSFAMLSDRLRKREFDVEKNPEDIGVLVDCYGLARFSTKTLDLAIERGYKTAMRVLKKEW